MQVRIFEVRTNGVEYQGFLPEDPDVWDGNELVFDGYPKERDWSPPDVYVRYPLLAKGDFAHISEGAFAASKKAVEELGDLLDVCAELLPLPHKSDLYYVVNVTTCVDVLDDSATVWRVSEASGKRLSIERYAFIESKLAGVGPLFKIPQTRSTRLMTAVGLREPEEEFMHRVRKAGLTGLRFTELWTSS